MLTLQTLKIGGRYNWMHQPERLVYVGMCEPRNGRWHQFEKVDEPGKVWCEVLTSDLHMLEETADGETSPQPPGCEYPNCECPIVGLAPQCGKNTGRYRPAAVSAAPTGGIDAT